MSFVEEYLKTVENEVSIDEAIFNIQGQSPLKYFYFPRPAKWLKQKGSNLKHAFALIFVFWNIGGSHMFYLIEAIRLFLVFLGTDKSSINKFEGKKVGLAFSERALTVIPQAIKSKPDDWVYFPWVTQGGLSILSFASTQDFIQAFKFSATAFSEIKKRKTSMNWVLHTYTAYKWFLSRIILSKVRAEKYYTAEHFDRWASMAGFVAAEQQKELGIIQHGILTALTEKKEKYFPFTIPNKIEAVSEIYAYDEESKKIFIDKIISEKSTPKVNFFKPTIELTKIDTNGKQSVLFVGNTLCEDFHVNVYKALKSLKSVVAYYKPHPTVGPGNAVKNLDWNIISDKELFPEVDLVISYPSTLVEEYANVGIQSVVHKLNANEADISETLDKLTKLLK